MNYLNIVLRGYFNSNNREYLPKYFDREFKKAEKKNYGADEFFNGCLKIVRRFEYNITRQMIDRKEELRLTIDEAKKRTLGFADNEGMEYNQLCEKTISDCEMELKIISKNDYSVHLSSFTGGKTADSIFYNEVLYIKNAILEAQKNSLPQLPEDKEHLLSIPTKANQNQILDFWFKLQGNNEKGLPYWENEKEIEHFVYQNFEGFPGVTEIKEFSPNMNKSELNHVTWTFYHKYGMSKTKKQYESLLMLNFTKFKDDSNVYSNIKDQSNEHLKRLLK